MVSEINPSYYSVMNHEIELKLRLNSQELSLLEQALASNQFIAEPTLKLLNRYFDTPQMTLSQGGAALRIRQQDQLDANGAVQDSQIIQTLKTRGTSSGGLHQRMEWDWPLTTVALNQHLIQTSDAQQHLSAELDLAAIGPLFTTDFQRKVWLYKQGDNVIELVLDQGIVATNEHSIDLLELELELKQGEPEILFQLAQQLADQCPVLMSDISKAERGYGLLARSAQYQQIKKDWSGKVPKFDEQQNVISSFKAFFSYQLSTWQRSLELAIWDGQQDQHKDAKWQLQSLQQLLTIFSQIKSLPEAQRLQSLLNQASNSQLSIGLIWGQISLACGHWLFNLATNSVQPDMTTEEKKSMQLHVEQLLRGAKG